MKQNLQRALNLWLHYLGADSLGPLDIFGISQYSRVSVSRAWEVAITQMKLGSWGAVVPGGLTRWHHLTFNIPTWGDPVGPRSQFRPNESPFMAAWVWLQCYRGSSSLFSWRPLCCVYFRNLVSHPGLQPSGLAKLIIPKSPWVGEKTVHLALCLQPSATTRCWRPAQTCIVIHLLIRKNEREKKNRQHQKAIMAVPLVTSQKANIHNYLS